MNPDLDWDADKTNDSLFLTVEVYGRTAGLIRLLSAVTGLSPNEVATRRLTAGNYAIKNIANFISLLCEDIIGGKPFSDEIEHAAAQLRLFRAAGHIHGFDDIDLDMAISEETGRVDEEIESLLKAAAKIIEEAQE